MSQLIGFLVKYWLVFVSLFLFLVVEVVLAPQIPHVSITSLIRIIALLPFVYVIIFGIEYDHYKTLRVASLCVVPLLTIACSLFIVIDPHKAYWFAREDFFIEVLSALAAVAASFLMFVSGAVFLKSQKRARFIMATAATFIGLAFFVIGGEEISWGQRIIGIESGQFFLENNLQEETNFHNLNTNLTMKLFYVTFFVFFVLVPFFRDGVTVFLQKAKLQATSFYIPSTWLVPLAVLAVLYYRPSLDVATHFLVMIVTGIVILMHYLVHTTPELKGLRPGLFLVLLSVCVGSLFTAFVNLEQPGLYYRQFPSEYREFFVCIVIFLYSLDIACRSIRCESRRKVIDNDKVQASI